MADTSQTTGQHLFSRLLCRLGLHRWREVSHRGVIATDECARCGARKEEVVYG